MKRWWNGMLTTAVAMGLLLAWAGTAAAETVTAPLNGTVSFENQSAPADVLQVDAGSKSIKAKEAIKIQGSPNSRITVITAGGTGIVHVADVVLRDGDSLYRVCGGYTDGGGGGGGGGAAPGWAADYNRGEARLLLEINDSGVDDNIIDLGANGGTLTVTVTEPSGDHTVSLTPAGEGAEPGQVGLATTSVTLSESTPSATIDLEGIDVGGIKITGSTDGLNDATVSGSVGNCPDLTSLMIGDQAIALPGGAVAAIPIHQNNTDPHVCIYEFKASYDVPTPGGNTVTITDVDFLVKCNHDTQNDVVSAELRWSDSSEGPEVTLGLVPCRFVELSVDAGEDGALTTAWAKFVVVGEVADASFGPFSGISSTHLSNDDTQGTLNIVNVTVDATGIGANDTNTDWINASVGDYDIPTKGHIRDGKAHLHVTEANAQDGIEVDPIKVMTDITIDDFWCQLHLDLFNAEFVDNTTDEFNLHMKMTALTEHDNKTLATTILEDFDSHSHEDSATPTIDSMAEVTWKLFTMKPDSATGTFSFNAVEWAGSFSPDFSIGIGSELHIKGTHVATATLGLDEDGTASATLTLACTPSFEVSGITFTLTSLAAQYTADILNAETPWSLSLQDGESSIYAEAEMTWKSKFLYEPGSRQKEGTIFGKLTFTSDCVLDVEVGTDALRVKCGGDKTIDISNVSLAVTMTSDPFVITKIAVSAEASMKMPGASADITLNSLEVVDGTLTVFNGQGRLKTNGFLFEVTGAQYTGNGEDDGSVFLAAKVQVTSGSSEVFSLSGNLDYSIPDGIKDVSLTAAANLKPCTVSGSVTLRTSADSWSLDGRLTVVVEKMTTFNMIAEVGVEGLESDSPWSYVWLQVEATVTTGIPLGPTGLTLDGISIAAGYNQQVSLSELGAIDPTPPSGGGTMLTYPHTPTQGHHAVGAGVRISTAGTPKVVEAAGGLLITMTSDANFSISLILNAWLNSGYAYGNANLTYASSASNLTGGLNGHVRLPAGTGTDAGKWITGDITATGTFAGTSWDFTSTATATVLKLVEVNGGVALDSDGDGQANGQLKLVKTINVNADERTWGSLKVEWPSLPVHIDASGQGNVALDAWSVDTVTVSFSIFANASGTVQATWQSALGDVRLNVGGWFTVGKSANEKATLAAQYDKATNKLKLTGNGITGLKVTGSWIPGFAEGPYYFTFGYDMNVPLSF